MDRRRSQASGFLCQPPPSPASLIRSRYGFISGQVESGEIIKNRHFHWWRWALGSDGCLFRFTFPCSTRSA